MKAIRGGLLSGARPRLLLLALFPAVLVASLMLVSGAQAAAGDLDPTFSGDGKQTTVFGTDSSDGTAVVRQADGKVVAVGQAGDDFGLARYNLDGSLDTTFSGDGRQRTNFGGSDGARDVVLQGDGKIVAVGVSEDNFGAHRFALARYNPNGSLDTTFSGDGKQTTDMGEASFGAHGVALQGSKIVVVGGGGTSPADFALARYNSNGSLDTTFSGDGKQTTDFGSIDGASAVAIQSDKIVAVGGWATFASGGFALARYNSNGSLDTTFSGDGKQTTDFGHVGVGVVVAPSDKVVVVGGTYDFAIARYNPNGSLDTTFSGDGKQTTDFSGADDQANDLAIQANGRIVAVGQATGGATGYDFALARYNADGTLDTSFSGDGKRRTNFGGVDIARGVALQGDGRVVAAGVGIGDFGNGDFGNGDFALARYLGG